MLAARGANGHLVQILDPAEETLPLRGLHGISASKAARAGSPTAPKACAAATSARLKAHREELQALAVRLGWSFLVHHTDRPATEPLLTLDHAARRP